MSYRTWIKLKLYCPNCGKRGHLYQSNEGDYYLGDHIYCVNCDSCYYEEGLIPQDHTYVDAPNFKEDTVIEE